MKIGAHVSAAGGIFNAPANAAKLGCEVFQIFSRSPQGGPAPVLTNEIVAKFKAEVAKYKQAQVVVHTPYYINFASTKPPVRYGSIGIVRQELERGTLIGAEYVVTHMGSAKEAGQALGMHKTWRSVQRILDGYTGSCQLLLEMSAGAGDVIGDRLEEIAEIVNRAEGNAKFKNKVNVCVDTCHAFASGYDVRTKSDVEKFIKHFDKIVGLKRLRLLHANDSMFELGANRDRHQHIGRGKIGLPGFAALLNHPKLKGINMIVETPWDGDVAKDIATLKRLRRAYPPR